MKTLLDWVKDVQLKNASAMKLTGGSPLMYRSTKNWNALAGATWSAAEVRNSIWPLLTGDEKKQLEEKKTLQGFFRGANGPLRFQFLNSEAGVTATFKWHSENERSLQEWGLPAFTLEKMQRQAGLSLIHGPIESGKTVLLMSLAKHIADTHGAVLFFSDKEEFSTDPRVHHFPAMALQSIDASDLPGRYVFIDSDSTASLRKATQLAEQGLFVFASITARTLESALLRVTAAHAEPNRAWHSMAENMNVCLGVRLISGLDAAVQPAFELLADTQEVKNDIRKGSVLGLVEIMSKGGDKSGMRTLNQALLQLLLKRKIELRVGFDESPNPQELDDLLKRVGV